MYGTIRRKPLVQFRVIPNHYLDPGVRPTNDISIEFEIGPKFAVLWFKAYSTDHNEILHTSRQLHCRDVCKISSWSVTHVLNWSTPNLGRISN